MTTFNKIVLGVIGATLVVLAFFVFVGSDKSLGAILHQSATLSSVLAGPNNAVTVLAVDPARSYVAFSLPADATTSANICFSSTCSATTGIALGTPTTTRDVFEMNSENLYTGIVTAYAAASGTRIMTTVLQ